jgi:antitoxin component of MazEF toxin-antitoxin module
MRVQTKVVKIGNSWGIRLPKAVLELCGLKPGIKLDLEVRKGRLIIRHPGQAVHNDNIQQAYTDLKVVWDEALEDTWLEIFGIDE